MESDQQSHGEVLKTSVCLRDTPSTVLAPQSESLLAEGISLILYRCVKLQVIIAESKVRYDNMAEYIRLTAGKVKHEKVEKIAEDILDLFLQRKEYKCIRIAIPIEKVVIAVLFKWIRVSIIKDPSLMEACNKLFKLYQDFLQGKYDVVEELKKSPRWIGEDLMEELKKQEAQELTRAHVKNQKGRLSGESRCERLIRRNYFV
ncbi:hypothetical protein MKW94_000094 [Papaver nudicaule]|uniref:Uncharacterized protein n=1 Tax=Papaver nudicaule TaxID=74823 RepID=A0AA42ART0_PAPNU|nr:hypothetical protein [Papaver nudicaule]